MQQQPEEACRRQLIANYRTAETKSGNCVTRALTIAPSFGQLMGDHTVPSREDCNTQQTMLFLSEWPAGVDEIASAQMET